MARIADPKSPWPKYGLKGMTDKELEYIDKYLKRMNISFKYLMVFLIRQWIKGKDLSKIEGVDIKDI